MEVGDSLIALSLRGVHLSDYVPRLNEIPLVNEDLSQSACYLGRDVDLGSLDAAIAAHKSGAQFLRYCSKNAGYSQTYELRCEENVQRAEASSSCR